MTAVLAGAEEAISMLPEKHVMESTDEQVGNNEPAEVGNV